jgi:hypothetical protein
MIYMTHPKHGAMNVYTELEAVTNEKNGWERAFVVDKKELANMESPLHDALPKKRGRRKKET